MAIKSKFIIFDTLTNFQGTNGIGGTAPSTDYIGNVQKGAVVFIKDTGQIWFNGNYFGPNLKNYLNDYYTKTQVDTKLDKKLDDYSKQYLTFTALESGTFTFSTNALQYSLDDGATWTTLAANTASPQIAAGNKILWKQTGLSPTSSAGIGTFSSTGQFDVSGNIMSLYYGDNFIGQTDLTGKDYAFYGLFNSNTKLINAENLILPATTLAIECYRYMFNGCTALTMAPELPATTLINYCYSNMFNGCTSLTTAPKLPATRLARSCYNQMFMACTSLTTAPVLDATTLAQGCYQNMFYGCSNLNYVMCLATDISATDCTTNWVNGVSSTGTFIQADNMSSWTNDNSGIPTGWNAYTEAEYNEMRPYKHLVSTVKSSFNVTDTSASRQSGRSYPVSFDSQYKLMVYVPWIDYNQESSTLNITANVVDGLWDLNGTGGNKSVEYSLNPYSEKQQTASFYTQATNPTLSTRLNYDGYLYATKLFSGGVEVLTSHQSLSHVPYAQYSGTTTGTSNLTTVSYTDLTRTQFWRDNTITSIGFNVMHAIQSTYGWAMFGDYSSNSWKLRKKTNGTWSDAVEILHSGNSSVSKSGETLTVKINGTSYSLTNSTYDLSSYLPLSGGTMTGNITINNNSIIYNAVTTSSWNLGKNTGLRILNTVASSATGAPSQYSVGLHVSGYYGFQLSCNEAGNIFTIRSMSDGIETPKSWVTLLHSGNSYISNGTITINGTSITPVQTSNITNYYWGSLQISSTQNYQTIPTVRYLYFRNSSNNGNIGYIGRGGTMDIELMAYNDSWLIFGTNSTAVMKIYDSGIVGIGIEDSEELDLNSKLHINGLLSITNNGGTLRIGAQTSAFYHFYASDSKAFYFSNSSTFNGNVYPYRNSAIDFGTSSYKWRTIYGDSVIATDYSATSDIRLKCDINQISDHVYSFRFKDSDKLHYGFIAQELEKEHPDLVGQNEYKTVNYNSALSLYIAELENRVKILENEINNLKSK